MWILKADISVTEHAWAHKLDMFLSHGFLTRMGWEIFTQEFEMLYPNLKNYTNGTRFIESWIFLTLFLLTLIEFWNSKASGVFWEREQIHFRERKESHGTTARMDLLSLPIWRQFSLLGSICHFFGKLASPFERVERVSRKNRKNGLAIFHNIMAGLNRLKGTGETCKSLYSYLR